MALFNIDLFFEGSNFFGWSERYFWTGSDIASAYNAAITNLVPARRGILPTFNGLTFLRASTPGLPPNSYLNSFSASGQGLYAAAGGAVLLPADTRIMMHLEGTDVLKNRKFMGGVFSQDVVGDNFAPTTAFNTAFASLQAVLTTTGWVVASAYSAGSLVPQATNPITSVFCDALMRNRKSGRPFGVPRGRRRTTLVA
jgi:hypothetical protein